MINTSYSRLTLVASMNFPSSSLSEPLGKSLRKLVYAISVASSPHDALVINGSSTTPYREVIHSTL
jgi:hypothetical protein